MSLSEIIYFLGRGPSKSRHLTREEAAFAMSLILDGKAEPEAVGAMLMLLRYRGESAAEIAGFVDAIRTRTETWSTLPAQLDWPSYAAGRSRGHPWFLLSAKLVAAAGHKVLLHGWNSHQNPIASVRDALDGIKINTCCTPQDTTAELARSNIAYVPVEAFHPELLKLFKLRDILGLRSPINTALRALNPTRANASIQGVFHPSYRELQQDAAQLLGQERLTVIKGGGGEFERNPSKDTALMRLIGSQRSEETISAIYEGARRLNAENTTSSDLIDIWIGTKHDLFFTSIITGTAALALETADPTLTRARAHQLAEDLWLRRHQSHAA